MTFSRSDGATSRTPLRLWPGVVIAVLVILARFVAPRIHPDALVIGVMATLAGLLAVLLWWLFFSRAPWPDRVGAIAVMGLGIALTLPLLHQSLSAGMMGLMFFVFALPVTLTLVFVAWAVAAGRLPAGPRRATMVGAILLACLGWTLVRSDGVLGGEPQLAWRWTPSAEERLLADGTDEFPAPLAQRAPIDTPAKPEVASDPAPPAEPGANPPPGTAATSAAPSATDPRGETPGPIARASAAPVAWNGFRGPARDGVVRGLTIETDWATSPPVEIWRRPIGPGWSSFAVQGNLIYTQEQRGEEELVTAYRLDTGEPVWRHAEAVRFWESEGGAGPRGTPAVGDGRVFAMGATGIVNALEAATGAVVWTRNAQIDTGATRPDWGFAGSPLVVGDLVVVAASGRLMAYDAATGAPRWLGPEGGAGYSSPHLAVIEGTPHIVLLRGSRTIAVSPSDGSVLWEHTWAPGVSIVQPAQTPDGDLLLTVGDGMGGLGVRRVAITREPSGGWAASERWTSRGLKPYFNDFVVHKGHAYGFDGSILSCIDLADGARAWKGGRYGQGQLVLLADQGLLLVTGEEGGLALVKAAPDKHTELARMPALDGKTWNHPVVVGDVLLVRNGEEMAAFRLPAAGR